MKRVIIESPFKAKNNNLVLRYQIYLARCINDSLQRGEAPFASHRFYTQYLDDNIPSDRKLGMKAGFAWAEKADIIAFYVDYGMSEGMLEHLDKLLPKVDFIYRLIPVIQLRWIDKNEDNAEAEAE